MNNQSRRDPKVQIGEPDRAAVAGRDPAPGARNRPGFDLGGAVGDAKPDGKKGTERPAMHAGHAVTEGANQIGDGKRHAENKAKKAKGRVRSAVAGVENWLRGK